jgi:hypothetical protein
MNVSMVLRTVMPIDLSSRTEIRAPFSEIVDVMFFILSKPPRVILKLINQTQPGSEIHFLAPIRWINIGKRPLHDQLVRRAGDARQR